LRIRQLKTGRRFSQTPPSRLRRLVSNVEVLEDDGHELHAGCNVMIFETQTRGDVLWAARTEYRLRRVDGGLRMARKTVRLVNNAEPLYSMAFLI
jgi:3-phenylpropionate/cinnamic acid dioxygenase small subunit